MSFLFGIVHLDATPVEENHISALAGGVKWEGFVEATETGPFYALGYCHRPDRSPNAGIFCNEEVAVLADIRLYNGEALQKSWAFDTPAEAFARAYLQWGTDCASHIDGDFSAVVVDLRSREVHLFRDPFGVRPLVWLYQDRRVIFASHEFGIAKSGLTKLALSEEKWVGDWFRFHDGYALTVFRELYKALPGCCTTFSERGSKITSYWHPERIEKNPSITFEEAAQQLRQYIVDAVIRRLEPGVAGVHVSGGLDSGAVASILADYLATNDNARSRPLLGYSWTPGEFDGTSKGIDERPYIEVFAEEKGIKLNYLQLVKEEAVQDSLMETFATQPIEHPVMKQAAKDGVTMLFSGWGGDECVSLSKRGVVNHLFFSGRWRALAAFARKYGCKTTSLLFRTEVLPPLIPFGWLPTYASQRVNPRHAALLHPGFLRVHWRKILFHEPSFPFGFGNRTRFVLNLMSNHHLADRMDSWALHAERYGFSYKYPLLDKRLIEFWFSLPIAYSYHNFVSRGLFREAMKGVMPEKVRTRMDKGEGVRMAYSFENRFQGRDYLLQALRLLPEENRPPFAHYRRLLRWTEKAPFSDPIREFRRLHLPIIYLRYAAVMEKYIRHSS